MILLLATCIHHALTGWETGEGLPVSSLEGPVAGSWQPNGDFSL